MVAQLKKMALGNGGERRIGHLVLEEGAAPDGVSSVVGDAVVVRGAPLGGVVALGAGGELAIDAVVHRGGGVVEVHVETDVLVGAVPLVAVVGGSLGMMEGGAPPWRC